MGERTEVTPLAFDSFGARLIPSVALGHNSIVPPAACRIMSASSEVMRLSWLRSLSQAIRWHIATLGLPHCFNSLNLAVRYGFLFHQISY